MNQTVKLSYLLASSAFHEYILLLLLTLLLHLDEVSLVHLLMVESGSDVVCCIIKHPLVLICLQHLFLRWIGRSHSRVAHLLLRLVRLSGSQLLLDSFEWQERYALVLTLNVALHKCLRVDTSREKSLLCHHQYLLLLLALLYEVVVAAFGLGASVSAFDVFLELLFMNNILVCHYCSLPNGLCGLFALARRGPSL